MPVNPKSLENLIAVKALANGESTKVTRIRALRPVNDWFSSLTAEERGQLVSKLYAEPQNNSGVTPDTSKQQPKELPGTPVLLPSDKTAISSVTPDIDTLSQEEQRTLRILRVGGVAEYDYHDKKWLAGFGNGVSVDPDTLQKLTALGFLELVSGEGLAAVYRAKPRPSAKKSKAKR